MEKNINAIDIVKQMIADGQISQDVAEKYFSELKESESDDESVRKELIDFVKLRLVGFPQSEKFIAWLEKKGEQKPTKYTLEQAAHVFLDALSDTPYNNKPITDAQVITKELLKFLEGTSSYNPNAINEHKPDTDFSDLHTWKYIVDAVLTEWNGIGQYLDNSRTETIAKKLQKRFGNIEQKPVIEEFNGEDYGIDSLYHAQRILEKTLGKVDGYQSDDGILEHKCAITAVKKLYEQKPAEWSKEDEIMLECVLDKIGYLGTGEMCKEWLKSLKDRVGNFDDGYKVGFSAAKYNQWKPSDRELGAMLTAIGDERQKGSDVAKELRKIYQQLKKLREE